MKDQFLEIGVITKPFGIKGELKVRSSSDSLQDRLTNVPVYLGAEKTLVKVTSVRFHKEEALITLNDIYDINLVSEFINKALYVKRRDIPEPDENEFYVSDLIGLKVINQHNEMIGEIIDCLDLATPLLEVKLIDKTYYVPFVDEFVKEITEEHVQIFEIEGLR